MNVFSVSIADRWGNKVFESLDSDQAWNGIINGRKLSTGDYVYKMNYKDFTGEQHVKYGTMALIE